MLQWTTETPTKPGWYWRKGPFMTRPYITQITGEREASIYTEGVWAGPIEMPPPRPTMFFTKPRLVGHFWYFHRFEDRKPETEVIFGPCGREEYAEQLIANGIRLFSPTHDCVRSTETLTPSPTKL